MSLNTPVIPTVDAQIDHMNLCAVWMALYTSLLAMLAVQMTFK